MACFQIYAFGNISEEELEEALSSGNDDIIVEYLEKDGDPNYITYNLQPLINALIDGDFDDSTIISTVNSGANLSTNFTVLQNAIGQKRGIDVIRTLIRKGANIYTIDSGRPLTYAVKNGYGIDTLTLLINAGASDYLLAIDWLLDENPEDEILFFLLDNMVTKSSYVQLEPIMITAIENSSKDLAAYLLEKGVNIHYDDESFLIKAIETNNPEMVSLLIENGADVHGDDEEPFYKAIRNNNRVIAEILLNAGIDVHYDKEDFLSSAVTYGSVDVAALLIENGADVHYKKDSFIKKAIEKKNPEMVSLLINAGCEPDLDEAFKSKNLDADVVKVIVDSGAKADDGSRIQNAFEDLDDETLIYILQHEAIKYDDKDGDFPIIQYSISSEKSYDFIKEILEIESVKKTLNYTYSAETAIGYAIKSGYYCEKPEILSLLYDNGGAVYSSKSKSKNNKPIDIIAKIVDDLDDEHIKEPAVEYILDYYQDEIDLNHDLVTDSWDENILTYAITKHSRNNTGLIKTLIDAGVDVNCPGTSDSEKPIFVAIDSEANLEIIQMLIEAGADYSGISQSGRTIIEEAKIEELDDDVIDYLVSLGAAEKKPIEVYYGEFRLGRQTYNKIIQSFASQYSGADSSFAYEYAKSQMSFEDFQEQYSESIIINENGIVFNGEMTPGTVSVSDNNIVSLSNNGKTIPFGEFSFDLNTLYLIGNDFFIFERVK